jgi:hypothetical protein
VPGFENTFYSIPEAITLGAWTLSRPFPAGEISPKREILNSKNEVILEVFNCQKRANK